MQNGKNKRTDKPIYIFEVAFIAIGLGCWVAWGCLGFVFGDGFALDNSSGVSPFALRLAFLCAFACAAAIALAASRKINSLAKLITLWATSLILLLAAQLCPLVTLHNVLLGISSFLLLAVWFTYLYERRTNYLLISTSIVFGSALAALLQLIAPVLVAPAIIFLPFVSSIVCLVGVFTIRFRINETLSTAKIWSLDFDLKYFAFFVTQDLLWGFSAFIVSQGEKGQPLAVSIGIAGVLAGIAVLLLSRNAFFTFERLLRSTIMVAMVILLCVISLFSGTVRACVAVVLFSVILVSESLGVIRDINQGVDRPFNEIHLIAFESLLSLLIGVAGFILGSAVYVYFPSIPVLETLIPMVLIVVLIIATLFSVGNFQSPRSLEDTSDAYTAWGKRVQRLAGRYDTMHNQVQQIIEDYQLTPRQAEIFHGLSRGRNAKFFEETLYLSEGTVKTHISAIYRKLDVHSRQELISFVESYRGNTGEENS